MQGHALFTRHAGSNLPCPLVNVTGGFNQFLAAAYGLSSNTTEAVVARFGAAFGEYRFPVSPEVPTAKRG